MSTIVESVKTFAARLAKATAGATEEIETARARIREKRKALEAARSAPIPLAEAEARVAALVKEKGESWMRDNGRQLLTTAATGWRALAQATDRGRLRLPWGQRPQDNGDAIPFGAWCAGDPKAAEAFLALLLRRAKYEAGASMAERPALIQKLEGELAELEAAEEQMVDAAIAGGLSIEHRKEVAQRRDREAYARQQREELERERATRQAALDKGAGGRRVGAVLAEHARLKVPPSGSA